MLTILNYQRRKKDYSHHKDIKNLFKKMLVITMTITFVYRTADIQFCAI